MKTILTIRNHLIATICVAFLIEANLLAAGTGSFYTGQWLINGWRAQKQRNDAVTQALFVGYVTGVSDAVSNITWEPPPGVTIDQVVSVVGKYLEANPEMWNRPAPELIIESLKSAFPKKANTK
ncbi:MAG: hypothetical protein HS117_15245 [Verrucomicrobiaceae bacterium]|nr:hypothetical protein [Verrucomicrobiaceae bacterium]